MATYRSSKHQQQQGKEHCHIPKDAAKKKDLNKLDKTQKQRRMLSIEGYGKFLNSLN